jgi:hypothetical protein
LSSPLEWVSSNGRARLRIYGDDVILRFNKRSGSVVMQVENALIIYEDGWGGERRVTICEEAVVWEDETYLNIRLGSRRVTYTEPISRSRFPPRRRAIPVYDDY